MAFRGFRVAGSDHYARLCAEPPGRHQAQPGPLPDASHYRSLARDKRREAQSILRHVRENDQTPAAAFARRQARELYDAAEAYEALAEQEQGGAQ